VTDLGRNGIFIALIAVVVLFSITTNGVLLYPQNVSNLIVQNGYVLVLAIGMVFIIVAGHIDLSVGSVAAFIGAVSGVLISDLGFPWWLALIGALLVASGQSWFVSLSTAGDYLLNVLPALVLTAAGIGLLLPAVSIAATADVAAGVQGAAARLLTTSQQVGAALGVATLATVAASRTSAGASVSGGYSTAFVISAMAMIVVVIVVAVTFSRTPAPSTGPATGEQP
jgi:putative multiple sugar transport system permease protein